MVMIDWLMIHSITCSLEWKWPADQVGYGELSELCMVNLGYGELSELYMVDDTGQKRRYRALICYESNA